MSTISPEQQQSIRDLLAGCHLPAGIGEGPEDACSIAAINLALTGKLTDDIPECMSPVIGRWIIRIQDAMPDESRNGAEWKMLLPVAAGTGRLHEVERKDLILKWMWDKVLPHYQPYADKRGFGEAWKAMCVTKTSEAALVARKAAAAAYAAYAADAPYAYAAAYAAADAVADAVADAADAADASATIAAARQRFWSAVNPPELLGQLIAVGDQKIETPAPEKP